MLPLRRSSTTFQPQEVQRQQPRDLQEHQSGHQHPGHDQVCLTVVGHCQNLTVTVTQGQVAGTTIYTDKGRKVFAFYQIPYAKPPVGQYRFREPVEPDVWSGIRNATRPGPACLQHVTQSFLTTGEEDCLYLNVYTPVFSNPNAPPPWYAVIVFFHNGVFITGNGNFRPTYLLDEDIVLVTTNYRLGVLGFLSTGDEVVPGNNGLKDQVAALSWVKKNIGSFGGDSRRVTIAGNTGGAVSVHLHYLSRLSADLFQQGIAQSGSALVPWVVSDDLRQKTEFIASTLNCTTADSQQMVDCLRMFSPRQLIIFTQSEEVFLNTPFAPFGPCVERMGDRPFLTDYPFSLLMNGSALDKPLLMSDCENEGLYPLAEIIDNAKDLDFLNRRWNEVAPYLLNFNETVPENQKFGVAEAIRQYYINGAISMETQREVIRLFGDRQFLVDNGRAATLHAKSNTFNPVYFYVFKYRGENSNSQFYNPTQFGDYGAANGDDLMYILDSEKPFFNMTFNSNDLAMRKLMVRLWASFAITGAPDVGNNTWFPVSRSDYDDGTLTYLQISSPQRLQMVKSVDFGNRTFWSNLPFTEPWSG